MDSNLPAVNASLNALATVLLLAGLAAIKGGRRERHERLMTSALIASTAFLACYLYYHFVVTKGNATKFHGAGGAKVAYFVLLGSHTILAMVNLPMVLRTFWLARKQRWDAHRRLARWTFPIWLYVSVTGVVVYVVLYHFNPPAAVP
jgi:uncharacterized membrane protein YozB (DUF420 family)